jgi:hypothetical protein
MSTEEKTPEVPEYVQHALAEVLNKQHELGIRVGRGAYVKAALCKPAADAIAAHVAAMREWVKAAVAKEREQCANECDATCALYAIQAKEGDRSGASDHKADVAYELAATIRARKVTA